MWGPLARLIVSFQLRRRLRKEHDATIIKVDALYFARIGSKTPCGKTITTRAEALKNLEYVRSELLRWERSIAIVHDQTMSFTRKIKSATDLCSVMEKNVTDADANEVNAILVAFMDGIADSARSIVRNSAVQREVATSLVLAIALACEQFEPFCKTEEDALAVRAINARQKMLLPMWLGTNAGSRIPWTTAEMEKYVYKVEREALAGTTWGQSDDGDQAETVAKSA